MDKTDQLNFQNTLKRFQQLLRTEDSFDILYKELLIGERNAVYFFVNGFVKDDDMQKLMASFVSIKKEDMPSDAAGFSKKYLSYLEVELETKEDTIIKNVQIGRAHV